MKSWQDKFLEKIRNDEEEKKNLILVQVKDAGPDFRCGKCDKSFRIEIYYSSGKYRQKVVCENCGTEFWTRP